MSYYTNYVTYPLKCSKNHLTCNVHFELWANERFFFYLVYLFNLNIYNILFNHWKLKYVFKWFHIGLKLKKKLLPFFVILTKMSEILIAPRTILILKKI